MSKQAKKRIKKQPKTPMTKDILETLGMALCDLADRDAVDNPKFPWEDFKNGIRNGIQEEIEKLEQKKKKTK